LVKSDIKTNINNIKIVSNMQFINNNKCFVCGKDNPFGFKLDFVLDGRILRSEVFFDDRFQGFKGIVHGGIISTMLDEVMVNLAVRLGLNAVTANLNVNLRKPAIINKKYFLVGEIISEKGKKVFSKAELKDADGNVVADAEGLLVKLNG